ncbi:MAG: hypothetical protein K0Q72_3176 [Armatimonadetes bacterium]|jgi:hypothetical protein|nr:hypothetical protein [Armatimonadota bacterium]
MSSIHSGMGAPQPVMPEFKRWVKPDPRAAEKLVPRSRD